MKKIKMVCKADKLSLRVKNDLEKLLKIKGFIIVNDKADIIISIGGDGTFIKSLRDNNYLDDPSYIGVNLGTLGFLQEVEPTKLEYFVECLSKNDLKKEKVSLQETKIVLKNNKQLYFKTFNEIVVREANMNIFKGIVEIEDFKLQNFIGDGLLISTSAGSTAYNMSLGGSIIHPELHTLQITPIAPLNNKVYKTLNSSVIVPETMVIKIIPDNNCNNIILSVDGKNTIINRVKYIETRSSNKKLKLLKFSHYNYWEKIESKFLK